MDEDDDLLYREMNPEDPWYMGPEEPPVQQHQYNYSDRLASNRPTTPQGARGGCAMMLGLLIMLMLL